MRTQCHLILIVVAMGALCGLLSADEAEDVARGHLGTIDQIVSIHALVHIDVESLGKRVSNFNAEFWQDRGKMRIKQTSEGLSLVVNAAPNTYQKISSRIEVLSLDRRVTAFKEYHNLDAKRESKQAHIGDMPVTDAEGTTLWTCAGFLIWDRPEIWFKDALRSKEWRCTAVKEVLGGVPLVRVEGRAISQDRPSFLVWFDPGRGYLIKKFIEFNHAGSFDPTRPYSEVEVIGFHPPYKNTGISFPAEIRKQFFFDASKKELGRAPDHTNLVRIRSVQINEPIAESVFSLTIPAGYLVIDRTKGQHYTMGADGRPQQAAPLVNFVPPGAPPPPTRRSFTWLLLTLAVLAAAGLGYAWYSRRRRLLTAGGGPG